MQAWLNDNFLWTQFVLCGAVVVFAGMMLARFGGVIGEKLKIGNTWIGLVLLAAITSMPELITSCTAGSIGAPDIAIGNVLGSNVFNIAILGILGIAMPRLASWDNKGRRHSLACLLSLLICCVGLLFIVVYHLPAVSPLIPALMAMPVDVGATLMLALYFLSMFLIFVDEKGKHAEAAGPQLYKDARLGRVAIKFSIAAAAIVFAGWRMVVLGDILSQQPIQLFGTTLTLGRTIIGTFFLAVATSLPEFTVCFAAIRMNAPDMAIGNVFGSNIFNLAVVFFADIFYVKGPILANVGSIHLLTGLLCVLMTTVFVLGCSHSRLFAGFRHLPLSITIVILWLLGWALIFTFGAGS